MKISLRSRRGACAVKKSVNSEPLFALRPPGLEGLLVGGVRRIEAEDRLAASRTRSVTKVSNRSCSAASSAISSAMLAGITTTPSPSPTQMSPGNTGTPPQPIGTLRSTA